ncbi:MAG: hypothetical protein E6J82_11740, partial [Deltaproteobacteria bacterium]
MHRRRSPTGARRCARRDRVRPRRSRAEGGTVAADAPSRAGACRAEERAAEKRGRRGAWWDEKPEKETEPDPDDLPGRTAVVQAPEPEPQPESEPKPPAEPEVEPYRPVPADDYQGHVPEGPPRWKVLLRRAAWTAGALVALGVIAALAGYVYISREIPTFDSVRDYHPFVGSKVVASDGSVIAQFYRERRTVVKMDQVPRVLVQAVISAEDKDFYKHPGFNFFALARAALVDAV